MIGGLITKRAFTNGKRPNTFYKSEPFLNFLDAKETSFLD